MLVVTTENVPNHRILETKGAVFGIIVRSRGAVGNIAAAFKSLFGGEIHQYTELLTKARMDAIDRMIAHAQQMGANAIIMMRFDGSEIAAAMSEIVVYGTAVVIAPEQGMYR